MKKLLISGLLFIFSSCGFAKEIVNIYVLSSEIPDVAIRQFEKETGIKVNISTYENNEILYAKLRTGKNPGYDVIMPSSYFVDRLRRQNIIESLDKTHIPNLKNIDSSFSHPDYDRNLDYSIPYTWGVTGIFVNNKYHNPADITRWQDLWDAKYKDQLLLLDDTREVFSMGLLALGYSPNDRNPEHIKAAFLKLQALMKNVKVFSADTVASIIIDEDATLGMVWNSDAFKSWQENPAIQFILPKEGFVIWVDNFAIPMHAPHKTAAYQFINFMLRADIAAKAAILTRFSTANAAGHALLPASIRDNPVAYPPAAALKHGQFQTDVDDESLALFEKYWEALKMGG